MNLFYSPDLCLTPRIPRIQFARHHSALSNGQRTSRFKFQHSGSEPLRRLSPTRIGTPAWALSPSNSPQLSVPIRNPVIRCSLRLIFVISLPPQTVFIYFIYIYLYTSHTLCRVIIIRARITLVWKQSKSHPRPRF